MLHTQDKQREYGLHHKETSSTWDSTPNNSNNNSEQKSEPKPEDESPKLTMKTWNSLTSDPATWPFKLPGAKPWPKDENGKTYNPNAELVRKLGLYSKNARLKDPKSQQKPPKNDKPTTNDTWPGKTKQPQQQSSSWYNDEEHSRMWNHWGNDGWPGKWKQQQFAYHKVTPATSKSLDKPAGKNAFIAVSALSSPRYGNEWRKNDIEEVGQVGGSASGAVDPNDPTSQMRMNVWKKSGLNATARVDVLENQLEDLKEAPVLVRQSVFRMGKFVS